MDLKMLNIILPDSPLSSKNSRMQGAILHILGYKRIHVSSIESKENLVFENLAKPSLYSQAHIGAY